VRMVRRPPFAWDRGDACADRWSGDRDVKNGIDDDTIAQTVRNAKAVNFDLTSAGQQKLTAGG